MLAPSYRKSTKQRQRGISLSRTSSIQKVPLYINSNNNSKLLIDHKMNISFQQQNINNSVLIQNDQNRLSLPQNHKIKYQSNNVVHEKQRPSFHKGFNTNNKINRTALQNSTIHNLGYSTIKQVPNQKSISKFDTNNSVNLWQQAQSMSQMIDLLQEYQKTCQQQMDLSSAQQARKKIKQLKNQQMKTRRKQLQSEKKQHTLKTMRQGQYQKKQFRQFWQNKLQQAQKALKQIQYKYSQDQKHELQQFQKSISQQQNPRVKYSSKVLQIRRNLSSLIKSRKYKQAQYLKSILQKKQIQQQQKWQITCLQKKLLRIKQFKKQQLLDLQAFKIKLNSSFNQLIKQKQKQQERMSKKMKKMQIQSQKTPSSIVRAQKNLLNESKARIEKDQ